MMRNAISNDVLTSPAVEQISSGEVVAGREKKLFSNTGLQRAASNGNLSSATDHLAPLNEGPLMSPYATPRGGRWYAASKRSMDIIVALIVIGLLLPAFVIVALCIYCEDRGPILYYQLRTGKDGQTFRFFKFRSMVRNADALKQQLATQNEATGPIFKMRNDPRITRTGVWMRRYSVDELPQLLNVLRGEMSLVGPRPLPSLEAQQCDERQWQRHLIQPGLLCYREIKGRSRLTFEQWMELDLLYIEKRSLSTDLSILLRVLPAVLQSDGAY